MEQHIDGTQKQLGELAAMAHQTQEAERQILAKAEEHLAKVEKDLPAARTAAHTSDGSAYMALIAERGRLHQVIAQARQVLKSTTTAE